MLGIEHWNSSQIFRNIGQILIRRNKAKTRNIIIEVWKRVRHLPVSKGERRVALIQ
jgi:hypothetical protein